jgi:Ras family protein A
MRKKLQGFQNKLGKAIDTVMNQNTNTAPAVAAPIIATKPQIALIGDPTSGKTTLFHKFTNPELDTNTLPYMSDPTKMVEPSKIITASKTSDLIIIDAPGNEDYDSLRSKLLEGTSAVIACFSIDNPIAYGNITEKWAPYIKEYCPNAPVILVGNKIDLRHDQDTIKKNTRNLKPISSEEGQALARKIGAVAYIECSAKNGDGVKEAFLRTFNQIGYNLPFLVLTNTLYSQINTRAAASAFAMNQIKTADVGSIIAKDLTPTDGRSLLCVNRATNKDAKGFAQKEVDARQQNAQIDNAKSK